MRALAARPRTAAELRKRLHPRFDDVTVDAVIEELTAQRLLDDAAYAAAWRSSRERIRPRSASLVRRELLHQGVARETAAQAVAGMDDAALAMRAAQAQVRRLTNTDDRTFTRRLAAYLGRRGFDAAVIRQTVGHFREERRQEAGSSQVA